MKTKLIASAAFALATCASLADVMDRPQGIKIGQRMTLRPYVSLSYTYDSNVDSTKHSKAGSQWCVNPGVSLEYLADNWKVVGSVYYQYHAYNRYVNQLNSSSYGETLQFDWTNSKADEAGWRAMFSETFQQVAQNDDMSNHGGRGIGRLLAALFKLTQRVQRLGDGLTLPGIARLNPAVPRLQRLGLGQGGETAVIPPVIQTLEIGQGQIHVGRVIGDLAADIGLRLQRVAGAALLRRLLLRLVEGAQQQHEKGHVVIEREPRRMTKAALQTAAEPAVELLITLPLIVLQNARGSNQITKHTKYSALPDKGIAALAADDFQLAMSAGDAQRGLAGGAGEKLVVLPLHPLLPADLEIGRELVAGA